MRHRFNLITELWEKELEQKRSLKFQYLAAIFYKKNAEGLNHDSAQKCEHCIQMYWHPEKYRKEKSIFKEFGNLGQQDFELSNKTIEKLSLKSLIGNPSDEVRSFNSLVDI